MKLYKCVIDSCVQCGNHVEIRNDIDFTHFLCSALNYRKFQNGHIPEECPLEDVSPGDRDEGTSKEEDTRSKEENIGD